MEIDNRASVLLQTIGGGSNQITMQVRKRMGAAALEWRRRNGLDIWNIIAWLVAG